MQNYYQQPPSGYMAMQPMHYQPPRGLNGRTVSSLSEVTINDVPNDGSVGWFPASDGSCVWAKQWRGDGSIDTLRYVPEAVPKPSKEPDKMDAIMERLDAIEAALRKGKRKAADDE